jgi:hypothetical protein
VVRPPFSFGASIGIVIPPITRMIFFVSVQTDKKQVRMVRDGAIIGSCNVFTSRSSLRFIDL